MITVYVVTFEPLPPNSVGGFEWRYKEADARLWLETEQHESPGTHEYEFITKEVSAGSSDEITAELEILLYAPLCATTKEGNHETA